MAMIYTEEQLNTIDKSLIIQLFLAEQELVQKLSAQVEEQNTEYSRAAEPPVRCGESHLSGLTGATYLITELLCFGRI